jgi:hypothetical protein
VNRTTVLTGCAALGLVLGVGAAQASTPPAKAPSTIQTVSSATEAPAADPTAAARSVAAQEPAQAGPTGEPAAPNEEEPVSEPTPEPTPQAPPVDDDGESGQAVQVKHPRGWVDPAVIQARDAETERQFQEDEAARQAAAADPEPATVPDTTTPVEPAAPGDPDPITEPDGQ